jgi:hypothetical protein
MVTFEGLPHIFQGGDFNKKAHAETGISSQIRLILIMGSRGFEPLTSAMICKWLFSIMP